jgi:nucleotide-binding universal stress UspA family protein
MITPNEFSPGTRLAFQLTGDYQSMHTATPPFSHLLVPFDSSEPARAALRLAIAIARQGATLNVVTVVDERTLVAESTSSLAGFDPEPLMEALDAEGQSALDEAAALCRAAAIEPVLTTVHEASVVGIIETAEAGSYDLIIMGTHARTGVARTFLGSTTEGVLRRSAIPVLTVRSADHVSEAPFATAFVAVDESEPAAKALAVAARLARQSGTQIIACYAIDTARVIAETASLEDGLEPLDFSTDLRREGAATLHAALSRAGLPEDTRVVIVDGNPADAIVTTAEESGATAIVTGTHGRRGLHRLVLGSVAESIVRSSLLPVLVVR